MVPHMRTHMGRALWLVRASIDPQPIKAASLQAESVAIKATDCRRDIHQYKHLEASVYSHVISNDTTHRTTGISSVIQFMKTINIFYASLVPYGMFAPGTDACY